MEIFRIYVYISYWEKMDFFNYDNHFSEDAFRKS